MAYTLSAILRKAQRKRWAVPHFNVSDLDQLRGVCEAAAKLRAPLMVGTSEGERAFIGLKQMVALIVAFRKEFHIPIFLNADHTKSVKAANVAIDAGYDSIHIDLSREPYEKNLAGTREVVRYARKKNRSVNVEGELGYLMTESSKVYKQKIVVDPKTLTKPDEAVRFIRATGVHRFAPAVGNLHGIAANRKKLNFALIRELRHRLPKHVALVLHGGSGSGATAFKKAIAAGITNIHISTELRLADVQALKKSIRQHPDEVAPYKLSEKSLKAVRAKAAYFIKLFGASGKA